VGKSPSFLDSPDFDFKNSYISWQLTSTYITELALNTKDPKKQPDGLVNLNESSSITREEIQGGMKNKR